MDAITIEQNKSGKYVEVRADGCRRFLTNLEVEAWEKKTIFYDYLNSTILDVHRWSSYPEVKRLTDSVASEIKATKKVRKHLRVVLVDLAYNYYTDASKYIRYSRRPTDYRPQGRYNKLHIAYRPLIKVIDSLHRLGYIENHIGFYDKSKEHGYSSRMRATPKFVDALNKFHVESHMISKHVSTETILLRDNDGNLTDYVDSKWLEILRKDIEDYTEFLSRQVITLDGVRKPQPFLCRIFNRDFRQGGRYYGGYWETTSSEDRARIKINGKDTVELDYSALQPTMLYNLKGLEYSKDPYDIEGYPKTKPMRNTIKFAMNTLINADSVEGARQAVQYKINYDKKHKYDRNVNITKLLDDIQTKHKPIKENFNSMAGIFLQNEDSRLMSNILKRCKASKIVALPIHDSLRFPKEHSKQVELFMKEEYNKIFKFNINIS